MKRTATISECGQYRYRLTRTWGSSLQQLIWCMLNPSTADAEKDDATIRKCIGFTKRKFPEHGGIIVVNLFGFRATNPKALLTAYDPVGPDNRFAVSEAMLSGTTVVAWGGSVPGIGETPQAIKQIRSIATTHQRDNVFCFGRTLYGEPRHPLMLAYKTHLQVWP